MSYITPPPLMVEKKKEKLKDKIITHLGYFFLFLIAFCFIVDFFNLK